MDSSGLSVVEAERRNAVAAWAVVAFLVVAAVSELLVGDPLWAGFVLVVVALAVVPAAVFRDRDAMLPWELLVLAALPVVGRTLIAGRTVGRITLTGRVTTYLAVAAIALVIAVEIDLFTSVRMNNRFAVLFVVVATTAAAGIWAVAQWLSDLYLGTALLLGRGPEHAVEEALMWDFVAATVAGALSGVLFEFYFRRLAATEARLPERLHADSAAEEAEQ
ncbi:MAG: hypothetical protein ABEH90_02960 [Halolamina sp.]